MFFQDENYQKWFKVASAAFIAMSFHSQIAIGGKLFSSGNIKEQALCKPSEGVALDLNELNSTSSLYMSLAAARLTHEEDENEKEDQLLRWGFPTVTHVKEDFQGHRGYIAENQEMVLVAIKGSDHLFDWLANGRFLQSKFDDLAGIEKARVHSGVAGEFRRLYSAVKVALEQKEIGFKPVLITGHSLGGALATILTYRLYLDGYNIAALNVFGQPKFANDVFANQLERVIGKFTTHVISSADVVASLPPGKSNARQFASVLSDNVLLKTAFTLKVRMMGYDKHVGTQMTIDEKKFERAVMEKDISNVERENDFWSTMKGQLSGAEGIGGVFKELQKVSTESHPPRFYLCKLAKLLD